MAVRNVNDFWPIATIFHRRASEIAILRHKHLPNFFGYIIFS